MMTEPIFTLSGKTILITGASSGIGKSVAIKCSEYGANVIITGRNKGRLDDTFSQLIGETNISIIADLTKESEIINLVNLLPQLDGFVNCAGLNTKSLVRYLNKEKIDSIMEVNFYAPALIMQSLLKQKKIKKNASVVMISSIASFYAAVSNAIYSASKGALNSLIRVLAIEVAAQKIRVNGIQPGIVKTDILNSYELQDELRKHELEYPLGRFGKPEEIAYAVIFLLSDASEWITGTSLIVDGGITLK